MDNPIYNRADNLEILAEKIRELGLKVKSLTEVILSCRNQVEFIMNKAEDLEVAKNAARVALDRIEKYENS